MTIVNDYSSVIIKCSFKLIDATRGIIYDCNMFIVQATALNPYRLLNSKQGASPRLESGKVSTLGLAPSLRGKIRLGREYQRGKHHCTIDFLFDWFVISYLTTDNFCFYLQTD
jgi:hypothetical protein